MSPGRVRGTVVADRLARVRAMIAGIHGLPLDSLAAFTADTDKTAAAESYLRRALEALLDAGRHLLTKGFGLAVAEYKSIADELGRVGVLTESEARQLRDMAGYRNRLVHFYHDVTPEELYRLCVDHTMDIEALAQAYERWLRAHPDRVDTSVPGEA